MLSLVVLLLLAPNVIIVKFVQPSIVKVVKYVLELIVIILTLVILEVIVQHVLDVIKIIVNIVEHALNRRNVLIVKGVVIKLNAKTAKMKKIVTNEINILR